MEGQKRVFYGWWMLLACIGAMILTGGTFFYGFGAFFLPIATELAWSRAAVSGAVALSRLEGGLLGPLEGYLTDRFGPGRLMLIGSLLMGAGFVMLGFTNSLVMFYLTFIIFLSFGWGLVLVPAQVAIANWFVRKRSTAMGIMLAGVNVGGMLIPLLAWFIDNSGWRTTAIAVGILIWVVQIPISFLVRHRPEQYGYLPDGEVAQREPRPSAEAEGEIKADTEDFALGFTPGEALKTFAFWFAGAAFAMRVTVVGAIALHLIPFVQDMGHSAEVAALMMTVLSAAALVGRVGVGMLGDLLPKRYVFAVSVSLIAVSMVLLSQAQSLWQIILAILLYAPSYGGGAPLMSAIIAEYFGRRYFGTINGMAGAMMTAGTVSGPVIAGYIFDVTQSYTIAFISFALIALIGVALILIARRPRPRVRATVVSSV